MTRSSCLGHCASLFRRVCGGLSGSTDAAAIFLCFSTAAGLGKFQRFSGLRRPRTNRSGRSKRLRETPQCECASSPDSGIQSHSPHINPAFGLSLSLRHHDWKGTRRIPILHRVTCSLSKQRRVPTVQPHLSVSMQKRSHRSLFSSCLVSPWEYRKFWTSSGNPHHFGPHENSGKNNTFVGNTGTFVKRSTCLARRAWKAGKLAASRSEYLFIFPVDHGVCVLASMSYSRALWIRTLKS